MPFFMIVFLLSLQNLSAIYYQQIAFFHPGLESVWHFYIDPQLKEVHLFMGRVTYFDEMKILQGPLLEKFKERTPHLANERNILHQVEADLQRHHQNRLLSETKIKFENHFETSRYPQEKKYQSINQLFSDFFSRSEVVRARG